jgi:hypothetical protein
MARTAGLSISRLGLNSERLKLIALACDFRGSLITALDSALPADQIEAVRSCQAQTPPGQKPDETPAWIGAHILRYLDDPCSTHRASGARALASCPNAYLNREQGEQRNACSLGPNLTPPPASIVGRYRYRDVVPGFLASLPPTFTPTDGGGDELVAVSGQTYPRGSFAGLSTGTRVPIP